MTTLPPEAVAFLEQSLGPGTVARPLAGDASVRAYYRVTGADGRSYILAYYPEEVRAQLARFLGSYAAVSPHASLPEVLHHCDVAVLQHDVGDRTIFDELHEDRGEGVRHYRAAIGLLLAFQRSGDPGLNAPFSAEFFFGELGMAREYYIEALMGADGSGLERHARTLCENVARHPYVLCHRDYHGQNIHVINDSLYLIDYQDLRMGPDTYDLASLLRDRGVGRILGDDLEVELIDEYGSRLGAEPGIRERYFETLLQRSIKILGTFAKQPIVRGRMHYLDFIPETLASIDRCLGQLPRYEPLRDIVPLQFDLEEARERARRMYEASGSS